MESSDAEESIIPASASETDREFVKDLYALQLRSPGIIDAHTKFHSIRLTRRTGRLSQEDARGSGSPDGRSSTSFPDLLADSVFEHSPHIEARARKSSPATITIRVAARSSINCLIVEGPID